MTNITIKDNKDSFDHLIYMRVYEGCNLHCKHCFIPANPKKMSIGKVKEIRESLKGFAKPGDVLLFQWHGGEPTARGVNFFKEALSLINELSDTYVIKHGIQTNLINYNEKWKDVYLEFFDGKIGVSWDPKIRLMKKDNPSSNIEYDKIFFENLERLILDGIEPCIVVTGTKILFEEFQKPKDFFRFFIDKGVKEIHVEKLTKTGNAIENWENLGLTHLEYAQYMSKLLKYYVRIKNSDIDFYASPFDGYIDSVASINSAKPKGYGCNSGKCDTAFHTVDSDGYTAGCTALTTNEQSSKTNNVSFNATMVIRRREKTLNCFQCEFKSICNSGCATEQTFDGSGGCSGGYLIYKSAKDLVTKGLV